DAAHVRALTAAILRESATTSSIIGTILEAADTTSAMQLIAQYVPQVVILDIQVAGDGPLRNGIDLLRVVTVEFPATQVIMLTNHATTLYRHACLQLGAADFLDKSIEFDQLPDSVKRLCQSISRS